ncbi:putative transcription factor capicua [Anopheles stephensi]|uniref:putative transcription factor capicua n=1 Tax=Anopheles stephensi TaxID=30069 RepID=UPI0016587EDB|nr:putative transcription factor capicua [Anopheles stephensi]
MLQNSAFGTPMLDGKPVLPEIYSHHQTVNKLDIVAEPQQLTIYNNNNADIANRNSSSILAPPRYAVERSTPTVERDGLETAAHDVQPLKTENNTSQRNDEITPNAADGEEVLIGTCQQHMVPHAQTPAEEVTQPQDNIAAAVACRPKKKAGLRRPMNVFILFCKRHRSVLKEHYQEKNRATTKKLGRSGGNSINTAVSVVSEQN